MHPRRASSVAPCRCSPISPRPRHRSRSGSRRAARARARRPARRHRARPRASRRGTPRRRSGRGCRPRAGLRAATSRRASGLIAGGVAEPIVDRLEVVEIEHQHRERLAGAAAALDLSLQRLVDRAPVEQSSEAVVARAVPELGGEARRHQNRQRRVEGQHQDDVEEDEPTLRALSRIISEETLSGLSAARPARNANPHAARIMGMPKATGQRK